MAEPLPLADNPDLELPDPPDVSHLITEDDQPLDNFFQDKQADILVEALRVSWPQGRPFLSAADVGIFPTAKAPAVVPDVLLSIGVELPENFHAKEQRSYYLWNFGKPPEVVIEVVTNVKGGEDTTKLRQYASIMVPYYAIYDPDGLLSSRPLRLYQMSGATYVEKVDRFFPEVGLGLTIWPGEFDGLTAKWLRWVDPEGNLLATGAEESRRAGQEQVRADQEQARADQERARADQEQTRADHERKRAEQLERRLRELGVEP